MNQSRKLPLRSLTLMVKLSAIQLCSSPNVEKNLVEISRILEKHYLENTDLKASTHIVVLPECCLYFGGEDKAQLSLAKQQASDNELIKSLAKLATTFGIYLVAGTIPLLSEDTNKFTNSSLVFSPQGKQISRYDKIHLFDVEVADNEKSYQESRYAKAGTQIQTVRINDFILGQTVCYDLRFPELFRSLRQQGADIIVVPSAFTQVTGKAHWQPLLQSRAIENQVYIIAAGQSGTHENGRITYGHSMIINPWGEIEAYLSSDSGMITQEFSYEKLADVRTAMPVHHHNQFKTEFKKT